MGSMRDEEVRSGDDAPDSESGRSGGGVPGLVLAFVSGAGMALAIALLFEAVRATLQLASDEMLGAGLLQLLAAAGGWIWLIPVALVLLFVFGGLGMMTVHAIGGLNIAPLAWTGLFLSLGWNFLRFGLNPPGADASNWGWIAVGAVFWLFGLGPFIGLLREARAHLRGVWARRPHGGPSPAQAQAERLVLPVQVAGVAVGVALGIAAFRLLLG